MPLPHHHLATADREVVERLTKHLIAAFEQFADKRADETADGLRYMDALMGCHNFYKAIIFDLEERTQDSKNMMRKIAIDTLALALGIPISHP